MDTQTHTYKYRNWQAEVPHESLNILVFSQLFESCDLLVFRVQHRAGNTAKASDNECAADLNTLQNHKLATQCGAQE